MTYLGMDDRKDQNCMERTETFFMNDIQDVCKTKYFDMKLTLEKYIVMIFSMILMISVQKRARGSKCTPGPYQAAPPCDISMKKQKK